LVHIFSSAPCSQTPPVCIHPLMSDQVAHPINLVAFCALLDH
jgi:hypothetical protein